MNNPNDNFVPHTSDEDFAFSGGWRPMLSQSVIDRKIRLQVLGKQTKDNETTGVLMPAFNWDMRNDAQFLHSTVPHMSAMADPKKTTHRAPTAWATPWRCYTFMGPANEHFISPKSREKMLGFNGDKDLLADAFDDIYLFIKRNQKFSQSDKDYYLKKPDINTDARVPLIETKYFANMLTRDKEHKAEDQHVIEVFTSAAYHYLLEQMRWATVYDTQPLDKDWPRYLIGDPTRSDGAMVWHQEKMRVGGLQMDSNVMCFTGVPEQLDHTIQRRTISPEHLANRVNLYSMDSWNWPTYQELADFALEHWLEVPRDLIAEACSHRANVGLRTKAPVVVDGGGVGGPAVGVGGPAQQPAASAGSSVTYNDPTPPPQQTAPAQQEAPAQVAPTPTQQPAAAAPEPTPPATPDPLWICGAVTAGVSAAWLPKDIQALVDSGKATNEQVHVDGAWVPLAAAGFTPPPPVVAAGPPPPSTPAGPPPPAAGPPPPAQTAALPERQAADVLVTPELQVALGKYTPTYASFSPEKQAEARKLVSEVMAHNAAGTPVPQELGLALGRLVMG